MRSGGVRAEAPGERREHDAPGEARADDALRSYRTSRPTAGVGIDLEPVKGTARKQDGWQLRSSRH